MSFWTSRTSQIAAVVSLSVNAIYRKDIYLALAQIHARGLLHGDVMPRNVVRRPHGGGMCFVDFGLAEVGHRCDPQSCYELVELRSSLGLPDNIIGDRAAGRMLSQSEVCRST